MNAAPPMLPAPAASTDATTHSAEPCAGRSGPRPIPGFLGKLTQALCRADCDIAAASAPERTAASSLDGAALPQVADATQPAATTASVPVVTPSEPPAPSEAEQVSAPAPGAESSGRPASPAGERHAAGERHPAPTRADRTTRADGQQGPLLAPVALAVIPLPVRSSAMQTIRVPDSRETDAPAGDGPVQGNRPGAAERSTGLHDPPATTGVETPLDIASSAPPLEVFRQHVVAVAQPLVDAPLITNAPALAAAALPNIAASGVATTASHADALPPAAPADPAHASPQDPAAQITPALVHIASAGDGAQHVTVRLDPVELGELRVRIERLHNGPVQVTVEATRPETLQLLHQDQPALHRALDQAGLASEGRVIVLQQANLDGGSQRQGTPTEPGGASSNGGQGSGRGGSQGWSRSEDGGERAPQDHSRRREAWLRAGIDITA